MNWTIGKYVINQGALGPGETTEVDGLLSECGTWGVMHVPGNFETDCFYPVTHLPSGMKSFVAHSLIEANTYCTEMNSRGNWNADLTITPDYKRNVATSDSPLFTAMREAHVAVAANIRKAREIPPTDTHISQAPAGGDEGLREQDRSHG